MPTSRAAPPSDALSSSPDGAAVATACHRCGRRVGRRTTFLMQGEPLCWRCALRHWPLLRRSLITAAVAGSFVTAVNNGGVLADMRWPAALYWKVPLTYCVPFCVATVSALLNARMRAG